MKIGFLALAPLGFLVSCTAVSTEEFDSLQRISLALARAQREYRLQPGDTVKVSVYTGARVPPEYQQQITVQPDGRITLLRVDDPLLVDGKTMAEVQTVVKEAYLPVFKSDAATQVSVQFLTSNRAEWIPDQVYVTGQVARPIAVPYRRGLTTLQAIAQAGGWRFTAAEHRTVVLRVDADGQTVTREVDLQATTEHLGNDVELFPGDVVYVPLSAIARVNLFIEFYIRGLIPINPSVIRTFATGI